MHFLTGNGNLPTSSGLVPQQVLVSSKCLPVYATEIPAKVLPNLDDSVFEIQAL